MPDSDLKAVLGFYPSVARPSSPPEPLGNAGGLSGSRLWRFESGLGTLVARRWPVDGPPRPVLEQVHAWLASTRPLDFVPVPLAGLDGRTLYERGGRAWEVTPWMPGTRPAQGPPSPAHVRAGFAALASFHQRLAVHSSPGPSPGLAARRAEVDRWLERDFDRARAVVAHAAGDPAVAALARRWLDLARPLASRVREELARAVPLTVPRQPCLRDVRPEHVLFTDDRVTGLVDFGAMGLETVAADLARLASEWLGPDRIMRAVGFDAYSALRPLSAEETALVEVFERSAALLVGGHWVRWHVLEGKPFDDPTAVARGLGKGLERVAVLAAESAGLTPNR